MKFSDVVEAYFNTPQVYDPTPMIASRCLMQKDLWLRDHVVGYEISVKDMNFFWCNGVAKAPLSGKTIIRPNQERRIRVSRTQFRPALEALSLFNSETNFLFSLAKDRISDFKKAMNMLPSKNLCNENIIVTRSFLKELASALKEDKAEDLYLGRVLNDASNLAWGSLGKLSHANLLVVSWDEDEAIFLAPPPFLGAEYIYYGTETEGDTSGLFVSDRFCRLVCNKQPNS